MEKRETRDKKESTSCCGFGNANMDSGKMVEMASRCCEGRKDAKDHSGLGKKMMHTMIEMCCGPSAAKKEQCSGNDDV